MLRIPKPTVTFKSSKVGAFSSDYHEGMKILDSFLLKPPKYSEKSTHIEVCSLKYPYKEFT
jgi:hypothetical protein